MRPLVVSHAACGGHAPENTLAGVRKALELKAEGIEVDVQTSADGVPVLMHDLTVDRTTNGSGELAKLSLEQLRILDAGGEPVPTLSEVLQIIGGRALLVIEIKRPGTESLIANVIRDSHSLGDVMVWSFFPQALDAMRVAEPRIPGALLLAADSLSRWPEARERALRLGLQGVSVFFSGVNEQLASDCKRSGLALYAWTADRSGDIVHLIELGIDGICTNFPDRAVALLHGEERS